MSRKVPQQDLPHYGIRNGWKRKANRCATETLLYAFDSISSAKRFMRTGNTSGLTHRGPR